MSRLDVRVFLRGNYRERRAAKLADGGAIGMRRDWEGHSGLSRVPSYTRDVTEVRKYRGGD